MQGVNHEYHIINDGIRNKKDYSLLFENASLHNVRANLRYYSKKYKAASLKKGIDDISGCINEIDACKNVNDMLLILIDVPDYLDNYVNDIKINVYEIAWLDDETIEKFMSDFKVVARFFSNKRKDANYIMYTR